MEIHKYECQKCYSIYPDSFWLCEEEIIKNNKKLKWKKCKQDILGWTIEDGESVEHKIGTCGGRSLPYMDEEEDK